MSRRKAPSKLGLHSKIPRELPFDTVPHTSTVTLRPEPTVHKDTSTTGSSSTFTVGTDKIDYAPGSMARVSATGLTPGATVEFQVQHVVGVGADGIAGTLDDTLGDNSGSGHLPWRVTDGGASDLDGRVNGEILTQWYVNPDDSLGATFLLTGRSNGADGQFGTPDDALATQLFTDSITSITSTGATVTLDETSGLQNGTATPSAAGDANDNDILVASLPAAFATRLTALGVTPSSAALSGYTGAIGNTGSNAFTTSGAGAITEVSFVGSDGKALNGLDSGLQTVGGDSVLLYTDGTNNNVLLGRVGSSSGSIVFAAYIDESVSSGSITGGKIWMTTFAALKHGDTSNADDSINLSGKVYVGTSENLTFDLAGAPSGQNLFLMYTTSSPTVVDGRITGVSIIATGKDPANQSNGLSLSAGDTINTSQAGGPTTFGTNNQMIVEGEGIRYTFVTGANAQYTIPNLDQNEADVEANIDFTAMFGAQSAAFDIVQLQSGKSAVVKITALTTAAETGATFIDGYANDTIVAITLGSITVLDSTGNAASGISKVLNADGSVTVSGIKAGDHITYATASAHNRVLIENAGSGTGQFSADFDIGGLRLRQVSTATAEIGSQMLFEDDAPSISRSATSVPTVTADDSDLATNPSAGFSALFTPQFNADGQAASNPITYALGVKSDGVDSGLVDTISGDKILLRMSGAMVEGYLENSTSTLAFTISVVANSGSVTLDQKRAVVHNDPADADEAGASAAGFATADLLTLTATIKDGDGDTNTAVANIADAFKFKDDGPSISRSATSVPTVTADDSDLATNPSASFSGLFTPQFNADGQAASNAITYALGVKSTGVDSGLVDTISGDKILLRMSGTTVEGYLQNSTSTLAFTISLVGDTVTLDQQRAVVHNDPADADEAGASAAGFATADLVTLTATIKDGDGDTNTAVANIADAFKFKDDGPSISRSATSVPTVTADDSDLTTNPSAGFSALFTPQFNADGQAASNAITYALGVKSTGVDSGLVDTISGDKILLRMSGTTVEGYLQNSTSTLAFTISVVANSGSVTLDQKRAVVHNDPADADEAGASAAGLTSADLVTLTATIKDGDGDTNTAVANIADAFKFKDDGPSISRNATSMVTVTANDSDLTTNPSAGFSGLFTPQFNADGQAASNPITYALGVKSDGVDSGLVDTISGDKILLRMSGAMVEGYLENSTSTLAFTISVVANSGSVTLDQKRAVVHNDPADADEAGASAAGFATADLLTLTATIKDGDGDTNTAVANIADAFKFKDDGPSISRSATSVPTVTADDSDLATNPSASFSGLFTPQFNADGQAASNAITYALGVKSTGVDSGLVDTISGDKILLRMSGTTVEGYLQNSTSTLAFTISLVGDTVTLDQQRAVVHNDPADADEAGASAAGFATADLVTLTATIKDGDGDTNTAVANIADAFKFKDDGPSITRSPVRDTSPTIGTDWVFSEAFSYSLGNDLRGGTYSSTNSDFKNLTLSGLVNGVAIGTPSLTWASESATAATFTLSFTYDHDRNGTATQPGSGTVIFDKDDHTYTVSIAPLQNKVDLTLGAGTGYATYKANATTPSSGPSPVATGKLGEGFYIQITGFEAPLTAGGNSAFVNGELVSGTTAPVTLSSTAVGVSGNTIQAGEAASLSFFTQDPKGYIDGVTPTLAPDIPRAKATDFYIKFDGFETETDDLILVLKLVDAADPSNTTTRALYVDQGDVYETDTNNSGLVGSRYQSIIQKMDNNDGLLIVESNDYNFAGEHWLIEGLQILSNDVGLTGNAINLNRAIGDGGGSSYSAGTVNGLIGPGNTIAEDSSTNPLKVIDAGFSVATTTPPTLDLALNFYVVDGDGDFTLQQTIDLDYAPLPVQLVGVSPTLPLG